MRAAVVKLGGSTADHEEMEVWTAALAGSSLPLVIVPGGGPFADQVRDAQKRMGFSDAAAHAMAILAMEQFGHVVLDRHERFSQARSTDEMRQALEEGRIPVWLPSAMAVPAPDIPASWDITSDSLAAWLAGKLSVETLLLIKQASNFSNRDDVENLTTRGILDAGFAAMLPDGIDLFVAGPRDAGNAAAMLSSGRLPGVRIASRTTPTPAPLWGGGRSGGAAQSNGRA
ncbi:dihydroneopterin aldolase [Mesorhizobium sp. CAU 1732]|uniref:amino acid kinase family protein n=1 Tax=Mesorhizobium sp. CAU 1732 TaxID=3140358 RepID=UPI003261D0E9